MSRLLLLINPASRQGAEKFSEVAELLKSRGHSICNSEDDVRELKYFDIIKKYQSQTDVVIVGGGDGSVNEALEGLLEQDLPLHVLPLGTANNLARSLEIPAGLDENISILESYDLRRVDVGIVNELYFINVCGLGLSTKVNSSTSKKSKSFFGVFAFAFAALGALNRLRPFRIELKHDEGTHRARSWQVSICNGRHYASGFVASEDAGLNDGLLDAISSEMRAWWHGFFIVPALFHGRHRHLKDVTGIRAREFHLTTSRPMKIDVDGDIKTQTPAHFSLREKVLKVLVKKGEAPVAIGPKH